jgi:hypothetical protein
MSLKLAMVLVLLERTEPLVIEARHMAAAQRLVQETMAGMNAIAETVHSPREGAMFRMVRGKIRGARRIKRSNLLATLARMGIGVDVLAAAIAQLVEIGDVRAEGVDDGGEVYTWTGK